MRHEVLMAMDDAELAAYGEAIGVKLGRRKSREAKVAEIEDAYERTVEVTALGETFVVPIRVMHDKTVLEQMDRGFEDNDALEAVVGRLLGERQALRLMELCTNEDGSVDVDGWALAIARIMRSARLKKYVA